MSEMKLLITGGSGFIGTNLVELLLDNNISGIFNVDKEKPLNAQHNKFWIECDIMDEERLSKVFKQFEPTHVLHLAARTDTASQNLDDYFENTEGTRNVINAIENTPSVKRVVITSTQYVYKSKEQPLPHSDEQYIPHTAYGISKKITEELTRNSKMNCIWTIIRPTNVWGPWNMRYPNEFLKIVDKGLFMHPGNTQPVKSYGYVKNVAHQIFGILKAPAEIVDKQVYYVGDLPMSSAEWVNSFSVELTGRTVRKIPFGLMKMASYAGDVIRKMNIPFPLHSVRFNNMIDDYLTPMQKTVDKFGLSHPDHDNNVKETINWIKNDGREHFTYWRNK
ncbi:NAD(P)-dependent oxidoreductase [Mucilaginibacter panaciglaebae]|uniref:NAD(P)-dependent oxidoreductase n=1 Tax=Mucilaginibacter panaciglaebae TaxID=502331 RepID=A0ABP7WNB9_9SPHI